MKRRFFLHSCIRLSILWTIVYWFSISHSFADISTARNFYPFTDTILTSGQPDQTLLEGAYEEGIEVVINIVPSEESIYNPREQEVLENQGITYFHTPVNWSSPKESEIKSFLRAMDEVGDRKVLVHCWSNARASALVHVHQMTLSSGNAEERYKTLDKIWEDVAGYSLEANETWKKVIDQFAIEKLQ